MNEREAIREAIERAHANGALSDDWAGALYANLDEPDKRDGAAWMILRGESLSRAKIEEALLELIGHSSREFVHTGGQIYHLVVQTMLGDDPAGHDYGPVVRIGPFTLDGAPLDEGLVVWDEADYDDEHSDAEPISGSTITEVIEAVRLIVDLGRQLANNDPPDPRDDGFVVCEWCAGNKCKSCGFTGRAEAQVDEPIEGTYRVPVIVLVTASSHGDASDIVEDVLTATTRARGPIFDIDLVREDVAFVG